jgi:hypothetical protein
LPFLIAATRSVEDEGRGRREIGEDEAFVDFVSKVQ